MPLIKTLSQALRMDKERFKVPKSVQQAIPIQRIWADGIFQQGTKFSKTYRFTDINYYIASKDNKTEMFLDYSELLNSLDSGISAKITINNRRINKEEFEKSILLPMKEDGLDHYREEYNEMLLSKITGTNNSIYQERYLTVSVHKRSIDDARTYFARIGTDIVTHLAKLSSTAEGLDAESRLQIFRDFFKGDVPQAFPFDLKQFAKKGTSFKDWMCPDSMEFERDHFKIGAGTHKRLADVPFRITSKTTGENHVVVTDDNGQFSTSADWASHKHNTNAGKTSEDGVWFGTSEPDDSKGALPYDTYIIEEMRCDSNKGFELIPLFEIVVSRNNLVIDLGTLTDEYEKEISIHTTATSKDGEKTILAGKEVTIVDTVKLDGLTKGTKYQLKGWQMLKEENAELIIDGKRVENDYTFVADDEEMKVEISYTFNASALGGKNLVTFEELYDFSNSDEPVKVAEHKDIEDDGQTVLITERIIKIHTTATDKDGNKELKAGKDVTIIDTVTLEGLEVGTQYKLVGWQMLKEENAELLINGKRVESDYTFIADSETMKVEVAFTFDATSLDGKQLVTFEELYDLSNPDEPKKVTEHKEIEDKGQTITFKEKPEEPEKPETPPTPEKPNRPSDSPKTGDSTNVMAFIVMLLASAGGLAGTYLYKRRKMKKS
ncbi:VaFE repeat-containing surface-anchored protein [[Ruminococcus] lactaris]|uniref:VaFE repeat-containing surface-anchored protein n=1 Tax=[Ruminococcus] lactaris TaxID=46228 RepID=UPI0023B0A03B|nr:VaFE repeat-containing surface-anchored protein [[Ruminococcus] lactaris]MDE8699761.1 VaFE repeat-containing surface-anchored protein [[Ruminococcus] lactaris]